MKKIFLTVALVVGAMYANAQVITEQEFARKMGELSNKRDALWKGDNWMSGGFDDANAKLYIQYSMEACALMEKYTNQLTDENEQIDLLWMQTDVLSDALDVYCKNRVGLSEAEYGVQFRRMVAALNRILTISKRIDDKQTHLQVAFDVKRELGEQYFKCKKYQDAFDNYKSCITSYQEYTNLYGADADIRKLGQEAYYYCGYSAYKLGNTAVANHYFNKAKEILNDSLIQPYK